MKISTMAFVALIAAVSIGVAHAECYKCECLSRNSDGSPKVTATKRVQFEAACSQGCGLNGVTCNISQGYCYPSIPDRGYSLTTLPPGSKCEDCGKHWTRWRDVGSPGLNPCPQGCEREPGAGSWEGARYRTVGRMTPFGYHLVPQEKNKFACFGTATGPAPSGGEGGGSPSRQPGIQVPGTSIAVPVPSPPSAGGRRIEAPSPIPGTPPIRIRRPW